MCGIISILSREDPISEDRLRRAVASLRHRGPDGAGVWLSNDRRVGLGHARLAVIDPAGGAQPIASEDGSVVATVNGEFYGADEIRRELEVTGHRFRTRSDSEIAVHLYEERGLRFVEKLRGEFALVLWDARRQRLVAVRDRFGVRPLVYAETPRRLMIASEAKALFAAGAPSAWDEDAFFHAASLQYVPADRTLFAGIRQVPPGNLLIADARGISVRKYWDLDYPVSARAAEPETSVREFRRRLDEAVRVRLRSDVPVCCHLSGGLDSSAVAALAARASGKPPVCFTVRFDDRAYDEGAFARETAQFIGADLREVRVSDRDVADALPAAVTQSEGLAVNGHLSAKFLLSRAISAAGFKVALTGEGSDEITAGYAHLREDLLSGSAAAVRKLRAENPASSGIMLARGRGLSLAGIERRLDFVPAFLRAKASLGRKSLVLLDPGLRRRFRDRDCFAELLDANDVRGQLRGRPPVHQSLYLWSKSALANYILRTLGDGAEMAHAVEGRLPFLDHRLFAFAKALPVAMKIRGGVEKYVLREAMRGLLPESVLARRKHPFVAPPLARTGAILSLMQDQLRGAAPAFYDRRLIVAALDDLPRLRSLDRAAMDPVLMMALSASILQERYRL